MLPTGFGFRIRFPAPARIRGFLIFASSHGKSGRNVFSKSPCFSLELFCFYVIISRYLGFLRQGRIIFINVYPMMKVTPEIRKKRGLGRKEKSRILRSKTHSIMNIMRRWNTAVSSLLVLHSAQREGGSSVLSDRSDKAASKKIQR